MPKPKIYHELLWVSQDEIHQLKQTKPAFIPKQPAYCCLVGDDRLQVWPPFDPTRLRLWVTEEKL